MTAAIITVAKFPRFGTADLKKTKKRRSDPVFQNLSVFARYIARLGTTLFRNPYQARSVKHLRQDLHPMSREYANPKSLKA